MGYAKSLGKQYNAGTAWSSLGTDRSAYEQSSLASHIANMRSLMVPGFSEYSTSGPKQSPAYEQGVMDDVFGTYRNAKSNLNIAPMGLNDVSNMTFGLIDKFNNMPDQLTNMALSGKYFRQLV